MKPDKAFRSNQQVLRSSINKRSTITRRSSWKPEKSAPAPKNKQFKRRLDISQAINEALDDYTAEHVDEYSRYQKELIPRPTIRKEKPSEAEKPSSHKKSKRTHSFDIQTHKSPVLSAKKTPPVHDELPPLESLSLHVKVKSVGPTGKSQVCAVKNRRGLYKSVGNDLPRSIQGRLDASHEVLILCGAGKGAEATLAQACSCERVSSRYQRGIGAVLLLKQRDFSLTGRAALRESLRSEHSELCSRSLGSLRHAFPPHNQPWLARISAAICDG